MRKINFFILMILMFAMIIFVHPNAFAASQCALGELQQYGDAFNIEGGDPGSKLNENQIWLNLVAVLDRPLIDKETLEQITSNNPYDLKESSLEQYNEAKVNLAVSSVILHYLKNGHAILEKPDSDNVVFTVQVHRGKSGKKQLALFQKLILEAVGDIAIYKNLPSQGYPGFFDSWYIPEYKTTLEFKYGYDNPEEHFLGNCESTDILFSFGLVGGLNSNYNSGTLLLPHTFVPFDVDHNVLHLNKAYSVKNHLITEMGRILESSDQNRLVSMINSGSQFRSPNPLKVDLKASLLNATDFKEARLLQVDKLYNPRDGNVSVDVLCN